MYDVGGGHASRVYDGGVSRVYVEVVLVAVVLFSSLFPLRSI